MRVRQKQSMIVNFKHLEEQSYPNTNGQTIENVEGFDILATIYVLTNLLLVMQK